MYFRRKTSAGRAYLQIVESRRDGDQVRQQVIATLGRFEEFQAASWSGCCARARASPPRPQQFPKLGSVGVSKPHYTTQDFHIRALTARHQIKPTSPRCPSAWQPSVAVAGCASI